MNTQTIKAYEIDESSFYQAMNKIYLLYQAEAGMLEGGVRQKIADDLKDWIINLMLLGYAKGYKDAQKGAKE